MEQNFIFNKESKKLKIRINSLRQTRHDVLDDQRGDLGDLGKEGCNFLF